MWHVPVPRGAAPGCSGPGRRRLPLTLIFALAASTGLSCVDEPGLGPGRGNGERGARLAIQASVTGLTSGTDYELGVNITYPGSDGTPVDLNVDPETFPLTGGAAVASQIITVDLSPCPEGCLLTAVLTLSDASGDLAADTLDLGLVHQGDQVTPPDTIQLVPSYSLTISGGGAGTGTGVVSVPAVGGQAELSCQITEGQAAETGCSGHYPLHTTLALTASEGTLAGWGGDCNAAAATGPCELTMDGGRTAVGSFTVPPTTGSLEVQIAGLPSGIAAQVTVTNTRGFSRSVVQTETLLGLAEGNDYTVSATPVPVSAEGRTYRPTPAEQQVTIVAGQQTTAQIGYNPPETGTLAVTILGLPQNVGALVTVTGPADYSQPLTGGATLSGLTPEGAYTITAQSVETSDQLYAPTPISQTRTIVANGTVQATVTYAATRGSLTVAVSGLPTGTDARITLTGPNGYRQDLTKTTTPPLVKLIPGSYTVTANSVTSGTGQVYEPTVTPTPPVTLAAGQRATVTVTYRVPAATGLVFTQQPPSSIEAGAPFAVVVTVEDAQGRPVPSHTTPITLTLQGDPTSATLGGTRTRTPQNGVATFDDLTVDQPGTAYALVANSANLPPATSSRFNVSAGPPASIAVTIDVTRLEVGQHGLATATVRDGLGNEITDQAVSWVSSNEVVVTATPTGLSALTAVIEAVGQGTAEIFASIGSLRSNGVSVQVQLADLGTLGGGNAVAQKVNSGLQVVGYSDVASGQRHAFLWTPTGGMADLGVLPNHFQSFGNNLNESGQIVGISQNTIEGISRAVLWAPGGAPRDLGTLGGCCSAAYDISNGEVIAGSSHTIEGVEHAFVWAESDGMVDIGTLPGTSSSTVRGINDNNEAVGLATGSNRVAHAFLWSPVSGMRDLGSLGGTSAEAQDINNREQVVGFSPDDAGATHAFLWTPASGMIDLGTLPGGRTSAALSINDRGQVVGASQAADGLNHAFLWTSGSGMVDLGILPGGRGSVAFGVSPEGHVVGYSFNSSGSQRAVRFR
jgi:probable HAF family extracellular repeat protein